MKLCIICREVKPVSLFNKEHVFPEAIGGKYTIDNVCTICNSKLGKFIDQPFLRHVNISFLRNQYELKSYGRKPGNPFAKFKHPDYSYSFKENNITAKLKPKKAENFGKEGVFVELSIDEKDYNDDFITKHTKRLAKKYNVSENDILSTIKSRTIIPSSTHSFIESDKPILLQALKVAYEFACNYIPEYIETDLAKRFAMVLEKGCSNPFIDFYIKNPFIVGNLSVSKNNYAKIVENHFVILSSIPSVGLVATVHFFDGPLKHPMLNMIILSVSDKLPLINPILLCNDFRKKKIETIKKGFSINVKWRNRSK